MLHERRRKLSPVLADEPLVGQGIKRRVRVILLAVVVAIVLTNITSYFIGETTRADANRDLRTRIAALERDFAADLDERRRERDAEVAGQDAKLAQLRRDVCTLADRAQPRDDEVQQMRRRYGCTGGPEPAMSRTAGGGSAPTAGPPAAPGPQPAPGPAAPTAPGPSSPPAPNEPDGGLFCLPLLGCPL